MALLAILKKVLIGLLVIVVVLLGIWTYQDNSAPVSFTLAGFSLGELPLIVWVLAGFAIGVVVGTLFTLPSSLASRHRQQRYRQRLISAEQKLAKQDAASR